MSKLTNYLKESYAEMKKVTWPSKKETYRLTLLVVGISLATALFLGLLDEVFSLGFKVILMQ